MKPVFGEELEGVFSLFTLVHVGSLLSPAVLVRIPTCATWKTQGLMLMEKRCVKGVWPVTFAWFSKEEVHVLWCQLVGFGLGVGMESRDSHCQC